MIFFEQLITSEKRNNMLLFKLKLLMKKCAIIKRMSLFGFNCFCMPDVFNKLSTDLGTSP